jgi:hypothetical protein
MKCVLALVCGMVFLTTAAFAAAPKTYQWTGEVVDLTDDQIVVLKGKEKWEIGRSADTKVTGGELKKGAKVTVQYRMMATDVEVKGEKKKEEPKKKDDKKKK